MQVKVEKPFGFGDLVKIRDKDLLDDQDLRGIEGQITAVFGSGFRVDFPGKLESINLFLHACEIEYSHQYHSVSTD